MGEIIYQHGTSVPFSCGQVLHFRQQVSPESAMTSFLVFNSNLLAGDEARLVLPGRVIHLVQLYPIYESEAKLIRSLGAERFFFDMGIDFADVRRQPVG